LGYFDGRIPGYGDVARVAHDGFTCLPDETESESPIPTALIHFFFFRQFAQVPHLVPRRPRTVDDIERKKIGKRHREENFWKTTSHDEKFKICTGSYVLYGGLES
jgi:hypothetical protein